MPPKSKETVITVKPSATAVVHPTNTKRKKQRQRKKKKGKSKLPTRQFRERTTEVGRTLAKCWADPFSLVPMTPLSGTLDSQVFTMEIRKQVTLTNGFGIVYLGLTSTTSPLTSVAPATVSSLFSAGGVSNYVFPNLTTATNMFVAWTPIAAALRAYTPVGANNPSGIAMAGLATATSIDNMQANSVNSIYALGSTRVCNPTEVVQVSWRPNDLVQFSLQATAGLTATNTSSLGGVPYVAFNGLPTNTVVYVDCIVHAVGYSNALNTVTLFPAQYNLDQLHSYVDTAKVLAMASQLDPNPVLVGADLGAGLFTSNAASAYKAALQFDVKVPGKGAIPNPGYTAARNERKGEEDEYVEAMVEAEPLSAPSFYQNVVDASGVIAGLAGIAAVTRAQDLLRPGR
jgi:hypothetical protein